MGKSDSREKLKAKEFEPQRTQRAQKKAGEKVYCCWVQGLVMSGYNVPIAEVDKDRVDWQLRA
jgi:hypothetical protein